MKKSLDPLILREIEACSRSPAYFLKKYVWIQNRNTGKKVKWEPWDYLLSLLKDFALYREIVTLKARQNGWTWLGAGWGLWRALFGENILGLYLSQGKDEASDMIRKARFIWENLPDFLRISLDSDQKSFITFGLNYSELRALPSTAKAGRGSDATFVWRDELSRHEFAKDNYASVAPTGAQLIDGSTIDKQDLTSHFTERVRKAISASEAGQLPHLVFIGRYARPVRVEGLSLAEWWEQEKKKYTPEEIEQEYPETLEDALRLPQTRAFFSDIALNLMMNEVWEPLNVEDKLDTLGGIIKVYKLSEPGKIYCGFTDPSDGFDDPHASIFMDVRTGEEVACSHAKTSVEQCVIIHDRLVRFYNNAINNYEAGPGGAGGRMYEILKNLGTPNIAQRRKPDGTVIEGKQGFWMTEYHKDIIMQALKEDIERRSIVVHTANIINECRHIIKPEGDTPRAIRGSHDDLVIALAGVNDLRKRIPLSTGKVISGYYKQSW